MIPLLTISSVWGSLLLIGAMVCVIFVLMCFLVAVLLDEEFDNEDYF